ncbi:MAG TPA: translation initiation factor IF-1 [Thermomicrobiales bacterium]|nr:translation initiation factor IF-1 [Thermomicrobiales bacterium]
MATNAGASVTGRIAEPLPNAIYRVALDDGREILAHVGGRLRLNVVRLLPGDRVRVELAAYDAGRGRIVERLRPSS